MKKDSSALMWLIARPLEKPGDPVQAALAELSERIRQIEARAISKLRRLGRGQAGPPFTPRRPLKVAIPRPA